MMMFEDQVKETANLFLAKRPLVGIWFKLIFSFSFISLLSSPFLAP